MHEKIWPGFQVIKEIFVPYDELLVLLEISHFHQILFIGQSLRDIKIYYLGILEWNPIYNEEKMKRLYGNA